MSIITFSLDNTTSMKYDIAMQEKGLEFIETPIFTKQINEFLMLLCERWKMKNEDFQLLLESAKQMVAIEKGTMKPGRVTKYTKETVSQIRKNTKKSQPEFARMIGVSVSTLRNWEQGVRRPNKSAQTLLKLVAANPKFVEETLKKPLVVM